MGFGFNSYLERCIADCVEGESEDKPQPQPRERSCNAPECCCDECWKKLTEVQP
jgi:hypothetical protein